MSPCREPFKLAELKIEVTDRCSLACVHCSSDSNPEARREINVSKCCEIVAEAAALGASDIIYSGGEPLLWVGLEQAVKTTSDVGLSCSIYTTGNVPEFSGRLASLARLGLSRVVFSLFAATAERHELTTRKRGSFDITIRAIQDARRYGLSTEIHFVPFSSTFRDLPGIAARAKELGVSRVSVLRLVAQGRAALLRGLELTRLQNLELKYIIERLRADGFDLRTGSPYNFLMLNKQPACRAGIDRAIVGPDLSLFPCDAFKQIRAEELTCAPGETTLKTTSLAECWANSPYLAAVRRCLTTPFAEPCASCSARTKCLSGCLAQKFIAHGDLQKRPDPMCLLHANGRRHGN